MTRCDLCGMRTPPGLERPLHHVGCGTGAPVNHRAVRGEGSQHDLPSRTAQADAAIGQPRVSAPGTAEVAPLGGGYGASFEEEDS